MSAFAADFGGLNWLCPIRQSTPLIFTHYTGNGFSLATNTWQPGASAFTALSAGLNFAANTTTAQVALILTKNGHTIGEICTRCNTTPITVNFAVNNCCQAIQRLDGSGVPMCDSAGEPVYDSASLDRYQLLLSTSAPLRIYGSTLLSWFAGHTI